MSDARTHRRPGLLIAAVLAVAAASGCAGQLPASGLPTASAPQTSAALLTTAVPQLPTADDPLSAAPVPAPVVLPAGTQDGTPPTPAESPAPAAQPAPPGTAAAGVQDLPARVLPASRPIRLQIPAIGVDSSLLDLGLNDDGTMQVPPDAEEAGWYTGAPTPGELGPAIIVAHVDWGGQLGVFYYLRDLQPGDEITVTRADGSAAVFRATSVEQFDKSQFPTDAVYGDIDHAGLRLITCGGEFDPQARSYLDNIIAFAELVPG